MNYYINVKLIDNIMMIFRKNKIYLRDTTRNRNNISKNKRIPPF